MSLVLVELLPDQQEKIFLLLEFMEILEAFFSCFFCDYGAECRSGLGFSQ